MNTVCDWIRSKYYGLRFRWILRKPLVKEEKDDEIVNDLLELIEKD